MDIKKVIFELAKYEKETVNHLGEFTNEDKHWFNNALGYENGFENDDVYGLSTRDIADLIDEFIEQYY